MSLVARIIELVVLVAGPAWSRIKERSMKSFDSGRFVAYGYGSDGPRVGWAEDGSVYSDTGTWQFRIDGAEVYGLGGDLAGFIDDDGVVSTASGRFLFRLEGD